jgi:glycosyltransferase involved in cell wall biosynthesis
MAARDARIAPSRVRAALRAVLYKRGLVDRRWWTRLRWVNARSRRPRRVGFGPVLTGEGDLSIRKWRIDPIVDWINRTDCPWTADIFFAGDPCERFDLLVIVKMIGRFPPETVARLRARGTRLVYDPLDLRVVPTAAGRRSIYEDPDALAAVRRFLADMDGLILSSSLQGEDFRDLGVPMAQIDHPVLNRHAKTRYAADGPVRLVWQGYRENIAPMARLHPILDRVARDTRREVELLYHTNLPARREGRLVWRPWRIGDWDRVLADSDVGVVIKPLDDPFQQRKPNNKVITYMAAGLPVVCTPCVADRGVIEEGVTGFLAEDDAAWEAALRRLVAEEGLRERIGRAARARALQACGLDRIGAAYLRLFDEVHRRPRPGAAAAP